MCESESHSVMFDSLRPHGLYIPWNSLGENTGVGSLSLLQGIFPTQGSNPGLPHCRQIFYQLSHREAQAYWSGQPIPSPTDLPGPGIEPGSPALQADSLPTELSGKLFLCIVLFYPYYKVSSLLVTKGGPNNQKRLINLSKTTQPLFVLYY